MRTIDGRANMKCLADLASGRIRLEVEIENAELVIELTVQDAKQLIDVVGSARTTLIERGFGNEPPPPPPPVVHCAECGAWDQDEVRSHAPDCSRRPEEKN